MANEKLGGSLGPGATEGSPQGAARSGWRCFAWLPIPILLAAIIAARAAGLTELYDHKDLRLFLSTIFYTLVSVATLYLFARSFLASGALSLLLLECGVVFWSLAGTVGDAVYHGDKNINVTIFNTLILLSGLCILAGTVLTLWPRPAMRAKAPWLAAGFALSVGLVVLIAWAALAGWFPVFLVPGQGGTPIRYGVLVSAIAMFVLSAVFLGVGRRGARGAFVAWYVPALSSLAVGLFGIMIQLDMDTLVNWLSRTAQWLGGFYLMVAALASVRETGVWEISLDAVAWDRRMALFDERLLGFLTPRRLRSLSALWRYGLAVAFAALAVAARWAAIPVMGTDVPHTIAIPIVVVSTVLLGLGPGLVSTLLAVVGDEVFVLGTPMHGIEGIALARLCGTLIAGVFLCTIVHAIRAAATKVRLSEERYRALADLSPDAIFVHAGGKIIYANAATARLFGAGSAADLVGQAVEDRIHPEERPIIAERITQAYDGQTPPLRQSRFLRLDGSMIWVEAAGARIRFDGQPAIQAVARDITERKQAEEALRESEDRLRLAVEAGDFGTWDLDLTTGKAVRSLRHDQIFGYQELQPEWSIEIAKRHVLPEDWQATVAAHTPAEGKTSMYMEGRMRRVDGSVGWFMTAGRFQFDAEGRPVRIVGVCADITERKQAEEALRESEERFRLMGDTIPYGAWMADAEGRNIYVSPLFLDLVGMTFEQVKEFGWTGKMPPEGVEPMMRRWMECVRTGRDWEGEMRFPSPDGRWHTILSRGKPVRDAEGQIKAWVGINLDITDRKQAEEVVRRAAEELKRSNEDLAQFAYVASHDLQEPLRVVTGFLNLLRDRYKGKLDSRADEYIGLSVEGATRMSQLIKDLLEYSRVDRQGKNLEPTDAGKALASAIANLRGAIQDAGATVTCDALPTVKANPTLLMQLLQNLVGNAIKFRSPNRPCQVHVGAGQQDGQWVLSVRDNGIGIPQDAFDRIFMIFQRLHTREEYSGTGIGLAICKKIVERHGGRIWVESNVGEGSTFHFTIPGDEQQVAE